ncbi:histidine phosphatase family protein [Azospirillum halopraeferens]|uniref:histidine phosphatase family protein n=1 Tax=Azospirillum halopraeferens TaxID=34010 RepID=UPI0004287769|nr:histidine phosphatase family protein [Azospirillum halopraeferens]
MTVVTTRWWLIRHAPVVNPRRLIYGQSDIDCDTGNADAFAALAGGLPRGAVWLVTQLLRTGLTAAAIRAAAIRAAGLPDPLSEPAVEPDLAEQHFGAWTGLTHDELHARGDATVHRFWIAPASERPPGGESFADVVARVGAALERRTAAHAGDDVVAVAHGGSIRAALAHALSLDPEAALRLRIDTLSLTRIDHIAVDGHPPAWRVSGVNLPPGAVLPEG